MVTAAGSVTAGLPAEALAEAGQTIPSNEIPEIRVIRGSLKARARSALGATASQKMSIGHSPVTSTNVLDLCRAHMLALYRHTNLAGLSVVDARGGA